MSIGIGDALREAREAQERSLQDAARDTRVRVDYLRALEEEEFGGFGGDVYAKGFLSTYARYLGLDPAPLLDTYRRYAQHDDFSAGALSGEPIAQPSSGSGRSWLTWAVVAVVVLAAAVAISNSVGGRAPRPAAEDNNVPPQPVASASPTTPAEVTSPTTAPSPSPSPTFEGVNLLLAFEDASWVRIQVDGQDVETGTIQAGETRTLQGKESVTIRFGNAGGVRAELNGQDLGTMGKRGEVVNVTFTPQGASKT